MQGGAVGVGEVFGSVDPDVARYTKGVAGYTEDMDRVRLGRALGYGTRHAAKTVAAVVEAASTSSPAGTAAQTAGHEAGHETRPPARGTGEAPAAPRTGASRQRRASARDAGRGLAHLKRAVWQPLAVFSGALWLRVTGLFFGLIAFTVGTGAWRLWMGRQGFLATRFWAFTGVAVIFAYFAVSSFIRASRKERRARSLG